MRGKFLAVMAIFSILIAFNIQSENTSNSMLLGNSIFYVGGPGNYTHIQDAIDNATDGDTIFVYNGVYYESIIVNKSINLIGEDRNMTIIDGNKTGNVVNVSTDQVNISGFTIKNATSNVGIYIESNCCKIFNNNIMNNEEAIYLFSSSDNEINENDISKNSNGIYLNSSSSNAIINCDCHDNNHGIVFQNSSENNDISNSTFYDNYGGIYLFSSSNNTIIGNNISAIENGIYIFSSLDNRISNCRINDCAFNGIHLDSSLNNTIFGNKISNNSFGISLENSSNNGIKDCNFRENDYSICLDSSFGNDIKACSISKNDKGILISESNNNIINNCEIYSNTYEGIRILSSSGNSINSDIFDNGDGVILNSSSKNNITYCNIYSNDDGIRIGDSSTDNNMANCEIYNNSNGISLIDSSNNNITTDCNIYENSNGIYLYSSSYNNISCCNAYNNSNAIYLNESSRNNIISNDISNNSCSIYIESSSNSNSIYRNNFIDNTAYDECTNYWNDSSVGNYWKDYTGSDTNGNRRGDEPYDIPGGSNQDSYPLMYRWGEIPPIAKFTWTPEDPTDLDMINFIDNSIDLDGDINKANWTWNFGDGNISHGKNVEHRYADNGTYQVNLTVVDNTGKKNETSKKINISNVPPTALFSWEPESPSTQNVHFIDKSVDLDGNITIWYWDFGDGYISNKKNPFHNYSQDGSYIVTLIVSDNDYDESKPVSKEITVSNSPPKADFDYSKPPTTLKDIRFIDKSSDPDGEIVEWHWDFGDGEASVERNATHRYEDEGKYTVTLTVKDNDGTTSIHSIKIEIEKEVRYQLIPGFEVSLIIVVIFIALFGRKIKFQ